MSTSLRGHLLVAASHLRDPNFYRSVVLMLEHSEETAMGLVINRPSSIAVDAAMLKLKSKPISGDPIFSGGPVDTSALFILHNCVELGQQDEEVTAGVFVTGSNDSFESLVTSDVSCTHKCGFRIYCGYAGWGPGQLEAEIDRSDWRIIPADSSLVFEEDPYSLWEVCTQLVHEQHRLLPHDVKNPEWN
ncbi:MAG: YqgE/AlgH family protein [Fuerstiella sp.]